MPVQNIGIDGSDSMRQQLVADEATVDEQILLIATGSRISRQRDTATEAEGRMWLVNRQTCLAKTVTKNGRDSGNCVAHLVLPYPTPIVGK